MSVEDDDSDEEILALLEYSNEPMGDYDYRGEHTRCDDCGGQMMWCVGCERYTRTCCSTYGDCQCS